MELLFSADQFLSSGEGGKFLDLSFEILNLTCEVNETLGPLIFMSFTYGILWMACGLYAVCIQILFSQDTNRFLMIFFYISRI